MFHPRRALLTALCLIAFICCGKANAQNKFNLPHPRPIRIPPVEPAPAADQTLAVDDPMPSTWSEAPAGPVDEMDWMVSTATPVEPAVFTKLNGGLADVIPASFDVGCVTVTPYGTLWTDMIYASRRTFPGFFTLWVESAETQGEPTYFVETRYSRIGANFKGPMVDLFGGINGGGRVEIDFLGGFVNENTTDLRLRHVYWEAKNENVRFLAGQTWDVISPLIPNTVSFPVGWGAGNIGFRRAQVRAERYLHFSDDVTVILQGALAQNINPDLASGSVADGVIREQVNWPTLEARTAISLGDRGPWHRPITLGVSGHIGETGFDFTKQGPGPRRLPPEDDARFRTWSFNVDVKCPITERLAFQGEFFTGANLSNQLGGILQGVCPCERVPIRATGGWAELGYHVNDYVRTHVGFGIDDPNNADSLIGRTYNRFIYTNVFVDLTENLTTGLEFSSWLTQYHNLTLNEPDPADRIDSPTTPGDALVIDWTVRYIF